MNNKEITDLALSLGFVKANVIDSARIVINPDFRMYCEENLCGNYGRNYSCPPDCGTPSEMEKRIKQYKNALVLQSSWRIEDLSQKDKISNAKSKHNRAMLQLINILKTNGYDGLMAGASECSLCNPCEKTMGKECRHPELKFSCLSAYCVNVKFLAEECSMNYLYKDCILSFFGVFLFNNIE